MIAIRLSDLIESFQHLAKMKRGPSGRARVSDRAILRPSSRGLEVDLPGGGTIIPVEGGHFEREVSIMIPALDALHKGLSKYKQENPVCAFRGSWAVISRDLGHAFHGIAGSHFTPLGRLANRFH